MYEVEITQSAQKDFRKLPKKEALRAIQIIESLAEEPRPTGCLKLQ